MTRVILGNMCGVPENDQKGVCTAQKGNPFPLDQHQHLQQEDPVTETEA